MYNYFKKNMDQNQLKCSISLNFYIQRFISLFIPIIKKVIWEKIFNINKKNLDIYKDM